MIASSSLESKSPRASSRLGKHQSQYASDAMIVARARAIGHSERRRLVSYDTLTPAARAASKDANAASHADAEIACVMADTWITRALRITSSGSSAGVSRLAADPARK